MQSSDDNPELESNLSTAKAIPKIPAAGAIGGAGKAFFESLKEEGVKAIKEGVTGEQSQQPQRREPEKVILVPQEDEGLRQKKIENVKTFLSEKQKRPVQLINAAAPSGKSAK